MALGGILARMLQHRRDGLNNAQPSSSNSTTRSKMQIHSADCWGDDVYVIGTLLFELPPSIAKRASQAASARACPLHMAQCLAVRVVGGCLCCLHCLTRMHQCTYTHHTGIGTAASGRVIGHHAL